MTMMMAMMKMTRGLLLPVKAPPSPSGDALPMPMPHIEDMQTMPTIDHPHVSYQRAASLDGEDGISDGSDGDGDGSPHVASDDDGNSGSPANDQFLKGFGREGKSADFMN